MKLLRHMFLLGLIYLAFISLGLPDSVLGVAWPSMREGWSMPLEAVGAVSLALTLCSALSGFASARVLKRMGTGMVVLLSGLMTGGALLGISHAPSFFWLFPLAIALGLGAGSVDAGLNHFVAAHYSSRHMSWLHASWGIGATIGPIAMGRALRGSGWQSGYAAIGIAQLSLAACFALCLPLWKKEGEVDGNGGSPVAVAMKKESVPAWAARLAPISYFLYSAVELGTGLWAATILVELRDMEAGSAAVMVAFYYGSIMLGRILTGLVADRVGNRRMSTIGLVLAFLGAVLFGLPGMPVASAILGLAFLGMGCAPVYPCLMHETPRRFDAETARTVVGRQVAFAYLGAAILPPSFGFLGARAGVAWIMPAVALSALLLLAFVAALDRAT